MSESLPPPPRPARLLHNFELPRNLNWPNNNNHRGRRWHRLPRQQQPPPQPPAADPYEEPLSPEEYQIIDWMNENLSSKSSPDSSSPRRSSSVGPSRLLSTLLDVSSSDQAMPFKSSSSRTSRQPSSTIPNVSSETVSFKDYSSKKSSSKPRVKPSSSTGADVPETTSWKSSSRPRGKPSSFISADVSESMSFKSSPSNKTFPWPRAQPSSTNADNVSESMSFNPFPLQKTSLKHSEKPGSSADVSESLAFKASTSPRLIENPSSTTVSSESSAFQASPSQKPPSSLCIRISTSGASAAPSAAASSKKSSSSSRHRSKKSAGSSSSSSGGGSRSLGLMANDREDSSCIDILKSGFDIENVDEGKTVAGSRRVGFAPDPKMVEKFEKILSISGMIDEGNDKEAKPDKNEELQGQKNKGKTEEKRLRTYVRSSKKKDQATNKEKKVETVVPKKEMDEDYKPFVEPKAINDDADDLNAKIWNFRARKPIYKPQNQAENDDPEDMNAKIWDLRTRKPNNPKAEALSLEKKQVGSSSLSKDQEIMKPVQERIDKEIIKEEDHGEYIFKSAAAPDAADGGRKKNDKKNKKQNKKSCKKGKGNKGNKGKGPKQEEEQETQYKLPKFSLQLTPDEIADDLFAMTGMRPSRKPQRRAKNVQRDVDFVTPGLWLEGIDAERYKVNLKKARKGKKKR